MPICGCGTVYAVREGEDLGLCDQCLIEEQIAQSNVDEDDYDTRLDDMRTEFDEEDD